MKLFRFSSKFQSCSVFRETETPRDGRFEVFNKRRVVRYELLPRGGETFDTENSQLFPFSPKESLLSPHIRSHKEQNPATTNGFNTSDMIQNDLYTSCDTCELDGTVFDVDPICKDYDDTSVMFDDEFNENVNLDDYHQTSRSKLDSETSY